MCYSGQILLKVEFLILFYLCLFFFIKNSLTSLKLPIYFSGQIWTKEKDRQPAINFSTLLKAFFTFHIIKVLQQNKYNLIAILGVPKKLK